MTGPRSRSSVLLTFHSGVCQLSMAVSLALHFWGECAPQSHQGAPGPEALRNAAFKRSVTLPP